ncbi:DUF732 domain-containing protein [Nonomuraea sp. NPDC052116]|uniref:DUF732 domain-containing protein n=1 Tax=Nonomuraea sp. NPDC052116 TaxID=3155665 RepID=UPI0034238B4A
MHPQLIRYIWLMMSAATFFVVGLIGLCVTAQANGDEPTMFAGGATPPSVRDPDDEKFLNDIHSAGIVAPDDQAIKVGHKVVDFAYGVVEDFGVYDYHVPAFVQAAVNAYQPVGRSSGSALSDGQFLNDIHSAGIVAPDDQAIKVGHKVVDFAYGVVEDFGVYDYHVPAFVQAAMGAYRPNATSSGGTFPAPRTGTGLSGDWSGTCTKVGTGATWDLDIAIRDDGMYSWTSKFPATSDSPGWTVTATGTVDRTSGQLIESEPNKGRIAAYYSVDGRNMRVDTGNGMARCSLTR